MLSSRLRSPLPQTMTTLDLVKTWAVLLMLIDMVGFFFFPDRGLVHDHHLWWRVIGRLSVPVWFFLVGYARTRDLSWPIWAGALTMLSANIICGWYIFPLDVLFTIILLRLTIDRIAYFAFERFEHLILVLFGFALFAWASVFVVEFGVLALAVALTGWAVRQSSDPDVRARLPVLAKPSTLSILYWASFLAMIFPSVLLFNFDRAQMTVAALGGGLVLHLLMRLEVRERPDLADRLGPKGTRFVQIIGRHTLAIYVAMVISFQAIAWSFGLGLPLYRFMDVEWTVMETLAEVQTILAQPH